jgi:hypothetical protein
MEVMSAKHTPGPWSLIGKGGTAVWAGDEIIAQMNGARAYHSIARANAQMMAAAPCGTLHSIDWIF